MCCIYPPANSIDNHIPTLNVETQETMLIANPDVNETKSYENTGANDYNKLMKSNGAVAMQDISNFLARPVICPGGSITWTTATPIGGDLMTMNVPSGLLTNPLYQEKIKGFFGFKGTLVIKLQSNAQRFQAGILLLNIVPASGHLGGNRLGQCLSNIIVKSQLPSMRFNIAERDEIELRVPYISPELFWNKSVPRDWARVGITVYSPLTAGTVGLTCWCYFEDTEFLYPTAQSGATIRTRGKKRVDPADQEDPGGILSRPLSTFSKGFGELSGIPLISSFSAPAEWFLASASKAMAAFGLSSVIETETRKALVQRTFSHMTACDVNGTSDTHGMHLSNKVSHMPGFAGTDIDEMSIAYIAQIPSYFDAESFLSTSPVGTEIFKHLVSPMADYTAVNVTPSAGAAVSASYFTPAGYLCSFHKFWRGSTVFRYHIAKTDFHSGRILFVFQPSMGASQLPSFNNADYCYRWVWDIRDSYSFEIEIPYVSSNPYTECRVSNSGAIGYLAAYVLNPLVAASTVLPSAQIIIEKRAGADFEVAGQYQDEISPVMPVLAFSGQSNPNRQHSHRERRIYFDDDAVALDRRVRRRIRHSKVRGARDMKYQIHAQGPSVEEGGQASHMPNGSTDGLIPTADSSSQMNALYCMGERILSIRQLLKRAALILNIRTTGSDLVVRVNPYIPFIQYTAQGGGTFPLPAEAFTDYFTIFGALFALRRGGAIIKAVTSKTGGTLLSTLYSNRKSVYAYSVDGTASRFDNYSSINNQVISQNTAQAAVDVHVPYYSMTPSQPVVTVNGLTASILDARSYSDYQMVRLVVESNLSETFNTFVFRSVSDDFSFGGFLGVVPITGTTKTVR